MQEIEILPRDKYLHYITLPKNHDVISWSFSTHKKSIIFGLFAQATVNPVINGNEVNELSSNESINVSLSPNNLIGTRKSERKRNSLRSLNSKQDLKGLELAGEEMAKNISHSRLSMDVSNASDPDNNSKRSINLVNGTKKSKSVKPELIELLPLKPYESNKSTVKGEYKVNQAGTYILYFDNTSSWSTSKKLTFHVTTFKEKKVKIEQPSISGWILKKKRKKMQGWTKRWCIIKDGILSYAKDENSIIRGSLNIIHSVATFEYDSLMLFIDSGSNFFRFKFLDMDSFKEWEKVVVHYLEADDINSQSGPPIGLEEIVESDSELQPKAISAITRSLSIKQSILSTSTRGDINHFNQSRCLELKNMIENLFIDFNFLSSQIEKLALENDCISPEPNKHVNGKENSKESKIQFFSFRSKKDTSTKSILQNMTKKASPIANSVILENMKLKLEELEAFKSKANEILEQELNQQHKFQLSYLNLVSEVNQLKANSKSEIVSPLPSPSDPSVSFQNIITSSRSNHTRRRSVYSRRQSSIMSMSSIGNNDEFFDALEGDESPDNEESVVIINESEDDDSEVEQEEQQESLEGNKESHILLSESPKELPPESEFVTSNNQDKIIIRRTQLPSPVCGEEISFLGILRKNVGKDLSTISLPISLNEPLNILQRLCEELEYFELLNKANGLTDSLERLIYVSAFAISPYAASGQRAARKPFNPLLGETYEFIRDDLGIQFISEKVSHNPPIFASYSESEHFKFWQESCPKSKFWGKSMELVSAGTSHVQLQSYNEHYTYNKAIGWMRNLVGGNKYLEYSGEIKVTNQTTKEYSKIVFKESTLFTSSNNEIKVTVFNANGKPVHQLEGQWSHSLMWNKGNDHLDVVFRPNSPIPNAQEMYHFTKFAIELNELTPDLIGKLPITDTRHRPDQRLFEQGKVQLAEQEKVRVEELQRARRKYREENKEQYNPIWFELKPTIDYEGKPCTSWCYKGGYFEARQKNDFGKLPDLWNYIN